METILLVLLIVYGSIGTLLAVATAVSVIADDGRVSVIGMLRCVLLWPLAIMALVVKERRARG